MTEKALYAQFDKTGFNILADSRDPKIKITYSTTTPESAEVGDFEDTGFEDEEGVRMFPDEYDALDLIDSLPNEIQANLLGDALEAPFEIQVQRAAELLNRDPAFQSKAIIYNAIKFLRNKYAVEASSSQFHPGIWYSTSWETVNYKTGEDKQNSFHLYGFTPEEEKAIYDGWKAKTR
jgi:hypothetical protein